MHKVEDHRIDDAVNDAVSDDAFVENIRGSRPRRTVCRSLDSRIHIPLLHSKPSATKRIVWPVTLPESMRDYRCYGNQGGFKERFRFRALKEGRRGRPPKASSQTNSRGQREARTQRPLDSDNEVQPRHGAFPRSKAQSESPSLWKRTMEEAFGHASCSPLRRACRKTASQPQREALRPRCENASGERTQRVTYPSAVAARQKTRAPNSAQAHQGERPPWLRDAGQRTTRPRAPYRTCDGSDGTAAMHAPIA